MKDAGSRQGAGAQLDYSRARLGWTLDRTLDAGHSTACWTLSSYPDVHVPLLHRQWERYPLNVIWKRYLAQEMWDVAFAFVGHTGSGNETSVGAASSRYATS